MGKMNKGQITKHIAKDGTVSYRVRVTITGPDGQRRAPQKTFKTRKEAEAALRQWLGELDRGTAVDPNKQTVAELLHYWLKTYATSNVRATTLEDYETTVNYHIIPALGSVQVQKLTAAQVQQFYAEKLAAGSSPRVVQLCHLRLSQALKQAVQLGLVVRNVCEAVTPPRTEPKEMTVWTREQGRQFLAVARVKSAYGPIWIVLLGTGMRRGEALGLRWSDVDFEKRTLRVVQSIVPYHGPEKQQPKSPAARRIIAVPPAIIAALREHKKAQNERRLSLGADWHDHGLVFTANNGNPIQPANVTRDYDRLVQLAGVSRIRVHDQRHTYITLALQGGAPMGDVSKRVGHAKPSITMNFYGHVTTDMQQQTTDVIDAALFAEDEADNDEARHSAE